MHLTTVLTRNQTKAMTTATWKGATIYLYGATSIERIPPRPSALRCSLWAATSGHAPRSPQTLQSFIVVSFGTLRVLVGGWSGETHRFFG
jgi:hypothetical protein